MSLKHLKKIPVIGPAGRGLVKQVRIVSRYMRGKTPKPHAFVRNDPSPNDFHRDQIVNIVNYTKVNTSTYNGQSYPAGYHTLDLPHIKLDGQRNPAQRIAHIPFDFSDKTVLDIGCNQGGMLFSLMDKIKHGTGIDYDAKLINAANKIKSVSSAEKTDFYVFNLEKDPLEIIRDFIPAARVDVVFLLSVCMWIKNWKEVINFLPEITDTLVFESNGSAAQQAEQVDHLKTRFSRVTLLSGQSADDRSQLNRKFYICERV